MNADLVSSILVLKDSSIIISYPVKGVSKTREFKKGTRTLLSQMINNDRIMRFKTINHV
jgi:hypothetical protein